MDSEKAVGVIEIGNLPLTINEASIKKYLEEQIGKHASQIVSIGLMTDSEKNVILVSRSTSYNSRDVKVDGTKEAPSKICFVSFESKIDS